MKRVVALLIGTGLLVGLSTIAWALKVEPDKENVVASRLEGLWKPHEELSLRLAGRVGRGQYEFRSDPKVAYLIPEKYHEKLKGKQIYMAGYMHRLEPAGRTQPEPFILIEYLGNARVIYFRDEGGEAMGGAESFNVMLAVAKDRENDLLFIGGDFNNQPFSAFERADTRQLP